jgi:hypothetical protein
MDDRKTYTITVGNKLDQRWADWFDGVQIEIVRGDPPRRGSIGLVRYLGPDPRPEPGIDRRASHR